MLQVLVGHEFPVAFDCIENYSIPLLVEELDTVLPEARQMDGRPLFLESHTVSCGSVRHVLAVKFLV